jgi:hypothetical protein
MTKPPERMQAVDTGLEQRRQPWVADAEVDPQAALTADSA